MAIWLSVATLVAISAVFFIRWKAARTPVAWMAIAVGLSVFAIRLGQPGDYAVPTGGNWTSAMLALGLGFILLIFPTGDREHSGPRVWIQRLLLAASPVVLFLALYSTLAELEEVVVLHTTHIDGNAVDLRLWIVDDADAGWIQMPIEKADAHGLSTTRIEMTRDGFTSCVDVKRFSDMENARRVKDLRHEKYLVHRIATVFGIFPEEPTGNAAILRITDCETD